jgi:hypothetical protein
VNAMLAFVIGFFVVASSQLVAIISEIMANVVLLLILITFFMLLVGAMDRERQDGFELKGWTRQAFYVIMFGGIILIFLNAFGWLQLIWDYLVYNWDSQFVGIIITFAVIAGMIAFVISDPDRKRNKSSEEDS